MLTICVPTKLQTHGPVVHKIRFYAPSLWRGLGHLCFSFENSIWGTNYKSNRSKTGSSIIKQLKGQGISPISSSVLLLPS